MTINNSTFTSDAILTLRSVIASGCTDPSSSTRPANSSFVTTHYPKRPTGFPFVVISDENIVSQNLGPGIESQKMTMQFRVDIFAKSIGYDATGRDKVWNQVYDALRSNQFGVSGTGVGVVSGTHLQGLHDFKLLNTFNIDEPGIEGVHRKIGLIQYDYYIT